MAQLLIRNLPEEAKAALRRRAGEHRRSMEAEARAILVDIVLPMDGDPVTLWLSDADALRADGLADDVPPAVRSQPRSVDLA